MGTKGWKGSHQGGIKLLESEEVKYDFDGEDDRFDMQEIQKALFSNQSLAAELLLPNLISFCFDRAASGEKWQEACEALKNFDGNIDLDSSGSVLFREWLTGFSYADTFKIGNLFDVPFNLDKPFEGK